MWVRDEVRSGGRRSVVRSLSGNVRVPGSRLITPLMGLLTSNHTQRISAQHLLTVCMWLTLRSGRQEG